MNSVFLAGQRANFQLGQKSKLSNSPPKRLNLKIYEYVFKSFKVKFRIASLAKGVRTRQSSNFESQRK